MGCKRLRGRKIGMTETRKRLSASSKQWYWKPSGGSVKSEPTPEPLWMKKFRGHITLLVATGKRRELAIRITEDGR